MFLFLQRYWPEFKTATIADVLGDLQAAEQGRSSDRQLGMASLVP
jgi:hypothetical protein